MKTLKICILTFVFIFLSNGVYAASSEQLAENLLKLFNMPEVTSKMVEKTVEIEINSSADTKVYANLIRMFAKKYLTWENLKKPMIKSYTDSFTLRELQDLNTFFASSTGKKFTDKSPELGKAMRQSIQTSILSYQGKLQEMIVEAELEKMTPKK